MGEYSKYADHQGIKGARPSKMPRYVRRLHTLRTVLQNKMAAELSLLISFFLDSKPENHASYFPDCVNSKHQFNIEVGIKVDKPLFLKDQQQL